MSDDGESGSSEQSASEAAGESGFESSGQETSKGRFLGDSDDSSGSSDNDSS